MSKSDVKKFKILYGIIIANLLTLNLPSFISIFIESWDILKVIYITVIAFEILLLVIYTTIFARKRFNKVFIKEWRAYLNNNRRSLDILAIITIFIVVITGIIKTWQLGT